MKPFSRYTTMAAGVCVGLVSFLGVDGAVTGFQWSAPTVEVFERAEASFALETDYANPYDPGVVAVDALVSGPEGAGFEMPAFWWEEVTWQQRPLGAWAEFNAPVPGSGRWKVRVAFPHPGEWSVTIRVRDAAGTAVSEPHLITVVPGDAKGFVRLDPADRQGFRFDSGAPYLPIGFNLCWQDGSLGTFYDHYLGRMRENGANWIRYWMVPFARQSIEWADDHWFAPYAGLGRYSQEAAALMDHVVEQAEAGGVYLQVVLEQMFAYSTTLNNGSGWAENPFNAARGGWLQTPAEWFTDPQAIEMTRRKYRYIVARWGYSNHILAWEFFNEYNFSDGTPAQKASWHKTLSSHLKEIDPYRRLITTSSTRSELMLLDDHPDIDMLQEHIYADPIARQVDELDATMLDAFTKPVLVGEYGSRGEFQDTLYNNGHPDVWGDHVRQASWIGSMNRVPNMFWFWDVYLQRYNLFGLYKPLADFWRGEDPGRQIGLSKGSFTFENAPPNPFGLSFAPGAGWNQGTVNPTITVNADGAATPSMAMVSAYLHGTSKPSMSRRVTFQLTTARAGKAGLSIGGVSSWGTKAVRILVDDAEAGRATFTGAGTLEIDLPAGSHTVAFEGVGEDWVTVTGFYFRGFDSGPVTKAFGLASGDSVYAYVLDQGFGEWAATAEDRAGILLVVEGVLGGTWRSLFVHPTTGMTETGPDLTVAAGRLVVPLPVFNKDVAVKLLRSRAEAGLPSNRLMNISLRAIAGTGDQTCITGFVIQDGTAAVLLRAAGPALVPLGVAGAADDPQMTLFADGQPNDPIGVNARWGSAATAPEIALTSERVGAFAFEDDSADAALLMTLPAGAYTVHASDIDGQGVVLAEVFDAAISPTTQLARIVNLSGRAHVGTGEQIAIAGFVIAGAAPRMVLLRAVGPGLGLLGVEDFLEDPSLNLYADGRLVAGNDDWGSAARSPLLASATALTGAFELVDDSRDAALLVQLAPGGYTVHISGADGGTGIAIVEVYDVPDVPL